jgi:hypothetical protein
MTQPPSENSEFYKPLASLGVTFPFAGARIKKVGLAFDRQRAATQFEALRNSKDR